jgi:TonB family protein
MVTLVYALKVNLAFATLFAGYWLALRQETWFEARRLWLLSGAATALLLPLLPTTTSTFAPFSIVLPMVDVRSETEAAATFPWTSMIGLAYAAVAGILLLLLVIRTARAFVLMKSTVHEACSFLGMIRMPGNIQENDVVAIRTHEAVHARQWHSIDILLFEVLAAVFWIIPFWHWALRELRLVHELTADAAARDFHPDYGRLIVAHAMGTTTDTLVHRFRSSHLKARIAMLYTTRSPRLARRKLIAAIPVLALSFALVSWQVSPAFHPTVTAASQPPEVSAPEFPGGPDALMNYLQRTLTYPWYSKEHHYQGTVVIGFTVRANGTIADAHVLKGVHIDLDAESMRVVQAMPTWVPGLVQGIPQDVSLTLPIRFQLSSADLFLDGLKTPKPGDGC